MTTTVGDELAELIRLLDVATGGPGVARVPNPTRPERPPVPCRYLGPRRERCNRPGVDDGWCLGHAPDDVAIERATAGDPVPLLTHERVEAVRRLAAKGYTDAEIAERLHMTERTVQRTRTKHGIPSQVQATVIAGYSIYREQRHIKTRQKETA